jgi:hypothetical protein
VKTFVACLATALAVFIGTSAFANAGGQAVTPKQFAALSKRVATLEKTDKVVLAYVGTCFNHWTPINRYGPGGDEGYVYVFPDKTVQAESALDITNTGDTANFYVPSPATDCSLNVAKFRSLAAAAHGAPAAKLVAHSRKR